MGACDWEVTCLLTDTIQPKIFTVPDSAKIALFLIGIFIGLPLVILLIRDRFSQHSNKVVVDNSNRLDQRLLNPDFAALEQHYDHALPAALVAIYKDDQEVIRGDFYVAPSADPSEEHRWYVAFYMPADLSSVKDAWPGTERFFAFADDGCGNGYLIDPTLDDPEVLFHDHETGELTPVASRLSEFMKWPRVETTA